MKKLNLLISRPEDYSQEGMDAKIRFLEKHSGASLAHLRSSNVDPGITRGNIENPIGFAQVPVGIVGPVKVRGKYARGEFYVPMGTTEGALVASYNRGSRAIGMSGGARVAVTADGIQRAPCFEFENLEKAQAFVQWMQLHFNELKKVAESTTGHGKLVNYRCFQAGRLVYVRFDYTTGDAMGMNMITRATQAVCEYIAGRQPIVGFLIESNMAVDKKPAQINTILGRGKSVTVEVLFKERVLRTLLRSTAGQIDAAYRRQVAGGQMAGIVGSNAHLANGLAAIFLACGQDLGNVSESCVGYIYTETCGKDLYVSLTLPSLLVGTVGGGVSLPTQQECLRIMDCYGSGKALKFAEVVAATLLAGEISLAAAVVAGDFVTAHEKLGRNRPE